MARIIRVRGTAYVLDESDPTKLVKFMPTEGIEVLRFPPAPVTPPVPGAVTP